MVERLMPLHPVQADFVDCQAYFAAYVGGIGSGKSKVLCYDMIKRVRPNSLYMMCAPTYPMLRDATLRSFFEVAQQTGEEVTFNRSENRARLNRSGAEIIFRSTDNPESLRGPNLAGVGMDEASLMTQMVYDVLIGRLRQGRVIGFLRAAFTPKGPNHWTHEVFNTGRTDTAIFKSHNFYLW